MRRFVSITRHDPREPKPSGEGPRPLWVSKAKKIEGKKRNQLYREITAVQNAMIGKFQAALKEGILAFRDGVSRKAIKEALESGSQAAAFSVFQWADLYESMKGLEEFYGKAMARGFQVSAEHLLPEVDIQKAKGKRKPDSIPTVEHGELNFSADNPRIRGVIQRNVGNLVEGINAQSQKLVQEAIYKSFRQGLPPAQAAKLIPREIGLTDKYSTAVDKYRLSLASKTDLRGLDLEEKVEAYRERLLDSRMEAIARTEISTAVNQGQTELWEQAFEQGLLEKNTTQKEWVIDPGTACPLCAPLDGVIVGMDEDFVSEDGPISSPPLHPNCNCNLSLVF